MTMTPSIPSTSGKFDLQRFVKAQQDTYQQALAELQAGRKTSHWMWYIFPQVKGLGRSQIAQFYALTGIDEAKAYLAHPILGERLQECCQVLLSLESHSANRIFGSPDDMKLKSSMTLFSMAVIKGNALIGNALNGNALVSNIFDGVLDKFYAGQPDNKTIELVLHQ